MSAGFIRLNELAPRRWKNGAGATRELAVDPPDAGMDNFGWRISVAEVDHDAPFSTFPGIDRCIVLLRGEGMRLCADDGAVMHRLDRVLRPFAFAGEQPLRAQLIGGPCLDVNVMVRRGRWRADVSVCAEDTRLPAAGTSLFLCCDGTWQVEHHDGVPRQLAPMEALLWRAARPAVALCAAPRSQALLVELHALCQDERA